MNPVKALAARIRNANARATGVMTALALSIATHPALAALPTPVVPGGGTGAASGDYLAIARSSFREYGVLFGLLIALVAFSAVAYFGFMKFNEWRVGRAEGMDVLILAGGGAALLGFIVVLLNVAGTIF